MKHGEALVANQVAKRGQRHRGIRFPNTMARGMAVEAMRKVDVVGYNLIMWYQDAGMLAISAWAWNL